MFRRTRWLVSRLAGWNLARVTLPAGLGEVSAKSIDTAGNTEKWSHVIQINPVVAKTAQR